MRNKLYLSDTDVGARQAALSISEAVDLLGFSHKTVSKVYKRMVNLVSTKVIKSISKHKTCQKHGLKQQKTTPGVLLSVKNSKLRLQVTKN